MVANRRLASCIEQVAGSEGSSSEESQDSLTGVSRGHKRKLEIILEEDQEIDAAQEDTGDGEEERPGVKFRAGGGLPSDCEVSRPDYLHYIKYCQAR